MNNSTEVTELKFKFGRAIFIGYENYNLRPKDKTQFSPCLKNARILLSNSFETILTL
jgi:hypothetical protein